jgi:hypothetical protein
MSTLPEWLEITLAILFVLWTIKIATQLMCVILLDKEAFNPNSAPEVILWTVLLIALTCYLSFT